MKLILLMSLLFAAAPSFASTRYLVSCQVLAGQRAPGVEANYSLRDHTIMSIVDSESLAEKAYTQSNKGGLILPLSLGSAERSLRQTSGVVRTEIILEEEGLHLNNRLKVSFRDGGKTWTSDEGILATDKLVIGCKIDSKGKN